MERRGVVKIIMALSLFGLLAEAGLAIGAPPENFTATMVMEGMDMPLARMGKKVRAENPMMQGLVSITLEDQKKVIMISTINKTYMEQPLPEEGTPSLTDPRIVVQKKKLGSETIDGHPCTKYEAVFHIKDKPSEKYQATIWEANDLGGLLIRSETMIPEGKRRGGKSKVVNQLKNIKIGAARASMFEVPQNYRRVSNMMEMMGGMEKMKEMFKGMPKR